MGSTGRTVSVDGPDCGKGHGCKSIFWARLEICYKAFI